MKVEPITRLDEHPFVARLSRFMTVNESDLDCLARLIDGDHLVKKRQDLIIFGNEYRHLCFVRDGYAIRYRLLRNGKRQVLNVVLPGDVIGLPVSFLDRSNYSVVAVSDLEYNSCRLESYIDLCYKRPQFGLALSWLAVREAATYAENLVGLGRRTPVERLAHFLLSIHARLVDVGHANAKSFELPFSQEIMSDVLGLSVPHLNRMMQQLRSDKLITSQGRSIELTNVSDLRTLAQYQPLDFAPIPPPR
jgi:CRP-like cAMP-binding protein